jgi:hypothetical protein
MPDFGRNSRGDDPSLDAIANSDRFIDALANGRQVAPQDQGDAMLAELLGEWRDELRWPPASGLITERDAVNALRSGLAEKQRSGRSRRGLSIVTASAAAVLAVGGFGAMVYGAGPGDALYGLHTMLFGGATKQVRDEQVTLASAQQQLAEVQKLVDQGDWPAAQAKLVQVSNDVATVSDASQAQEVLQQKQQVLEQWNQLSAKVVQQDPAATVPPGITYTVPPSATELIPTPITLTTGPEVPPNCRSADCGPITLSTTPDGTGTFGPSTSDIPTSQVEQTEVTTTTTTVAPTTTTTTSVAPTTTTTTAAPTTSTATATTTTTQLPTTSTTTTTTQLPTTTTTTTTAGGVTTTSASAAAQSPAVATTSQPAAQSPAAAATTSTVVQQSSAVPTVASAPSVTAQQTVAPEAPTVAQAPAQAPRTQPPAAVITTTMMMPMPQAPKQPSSGGGHSNGGGGN